MAERRRYTDRQRQAPPGSQRKELYDPDWLTVRAIAEKLSVSERQVRKWVAAKQFDEIKSFGPRLVRISRASYERFVAKSQAA